MQNIFPALRYRDAGAAIEWLARAFGFEEHLVVPGENGAIVHAELTLGDGRMVMLSSDREDRYGSRVGLGWLYVVVDDPDALFARAQAAGAEVVQELVDTDYGSRDFGVRDPEGNVWNFGTYNPLRAPANASSTAETA
jgi:uncharacterized glyoxalase superfamily protein PhnB